MKVGQIFLLPPDVLYKVGDRGNVKDRETATKIIAKYEVVKQCSCGAILFNDNEMVKHLKDCSKSIELKGRVTNTYGHKRRKK